MQTKRLRRLSPATNFFIGLPDHLIIFILGKLAASADSPSDLISIAITCTRFSVLGLDPFVLSKASPRSLAVRAKTWCESTKRFLTRCADAGNVDACYILGVIRFYLLSCRRSGAELIKKAAGGGHLEAVYCLAVIQLNSSGRAAKSDKDLSSGVELAGFAALQGHMDALQETGYCLLDGYGIERDVESGWRYLIKAKAREIVEAHRRSASLSNVGWSIPVLEQHPANRFLLESFEEGRAELGEGLTLCSNKRCGRPETRPNEFRLCSVCRKARYCTRTCCVFDRKVRHWVECTPMAPPAAAAAPPPAEGGA